MEFDTLGIKARHLIHDRDTKLAKQFDAIFNLEGVKLVSLSVASPLTHVYCERVIQTIKREAFD